MKRKFFAFALSATLTLASFCGYASTPEQEKAFVDAYKTAFEGKDTAKLESFLYTKGADPQALAFYKMMMTNDLGQKISKIELRKLTPEEVKKATGILPGPTGNAKMPLAPNLKLVIAIEKKDANGSSTSTSESFVAEADGKLVIPVPVPAK